MERHAVLETLRQYFAARQGVVAAYLFGSVARGTQHANSDVDVAVLLAGRAPRSLEDHDVVFAIQDDLEDTLHHRVDIVVMNDAPLDLLHRVLRDGVCVHDADSDQRAEFELQARTQYYDFLPVLLRYRRAMLEGA